jgi:hypothetical protein
MEMTDMARGSVSSHLLVRSIVLMPTIFLFAWIGCNAEIGTPAPPDANHGTEDRYTERFSRAIQVIGDYLPVETYAVLTRVKGKAKPWYHACRSYMSGQFHAEDRVIDGIGYSASYLVHIDTGALVSLQFSTARTLFGPDAPRISVDEARQTAIRVQELLGGFPPFPIVDREFDGDERQNSYIFRWFRVNRHGDRYENESISMSIDWMGRLVAYHRWGNDHPEVDIIPLVEAPDALRIADEVTHAKRTGREWGGDKCYKILRYRKTIAFPRELACGLEGLPPKLKEGLPKPTETRLFYVVEFYPVWSGDEEASRDDATSADVVPIDAVTGEVLFVPPHLYNRCGPDNLPVTD